LLGVTTQDVHIVRSNESQTKEDRGWGRFRYFWDDRACHNVKYWKKRDRIKRCARTSWQ